MGDYDALCSAFILLVVTRICILLATVGVTVTWLQTTVQGFVLLFFLGFNWYAKKGVIQRYLYDSTTTLIISTVNKWLLLLAGEDAFDNSGVIYFISFKTLVIHAPMYITMLQNSCNAVTNATTEKKMRVYTD